MDRKVYEFISKQTQDPIVEWKTCKVSGQPFAIFQSDLDFYEKISPVYNEKRYLLPAPILCPEERQRRRMARKNDQMYFKRTCDFSGESMVSIYHPSVSGPVYKVKYRRSDKRDAKDYGMDIDEKISILDQYKKLFIQVPKIAMVNDDGIKSENCEYCQNMALSKDCYLNTVSRKLRDCYYSSNMANGELLIDSFFTMDSKVCYECKEGHNLYECFYTSHCSDCTRCFLAYELHGCKDCICCVGLSNAQYCIFNEQLSKEKYDEESKKLREEFANDPTRIQNAYAEFLQKFPRKTMNLVTTENSFGNNLVNAQNNVACYNLKNSKNCKYRMFGDTGVDGIDLTVGGELDLCYESIVPDFSHQVGFTNFCRSCDDVRYSEMCHGCKHCFACIGLKNQEYCILNKQYSKEAYQQKVGAIIERMIAAGEWGEFFPIAMSPFAYNHTIAQDYFPLDKTNISRFTTMRIDEIKECNIPDGTEVIDGNELPCNADMIDDSILKKAIQCIESGRIFKIMPKELAFYRKYGIPLPRKHPLQRYRERIAHMPPKELYFRTCDKCGIEMLSVYKEKAEFEVYCEECYNRTMY